MHLLTMEAHTASLQPDTEAAIMLVASARLVTAAAATTASLATDPSTAPPSPRPLVICKETVVNIGVHNFDMYIVIKHNIRL